MATFDSEAKYLQSQTSLAARITAIDAIIDALMLVAAEAAEDDNINEYWLNDGQTQIKTIYKGAHNVERSIQKFERLRNMYLGRLRGRMTRLVDSKNFPRI
jgi:hypothetical protein